MIKGMRIVHASLPKEEVKKINAEEFSREVVNSHFNAQHLEYSMSYDGESKIFLFNTKKAREIPRDFLKEYLPEAHKRGIFVFIYINVHWANKLFIREHPDWVQRLADGKPLTGLYGGEGTSLCVNSPWREWIFSLIHELASNYDIDGIFFDGPSFYLGTCYCESCKKKFKERYGENLPLKEDWSNPNWRNFIEFRSQSIDEFLADANKVLKGIKKEALLYMNSQPLSPFWINGRDNRRLIKHQDILGAEGGFIYGKLIETPLWKASATAKLLETEAGGKPRVVFCALNHKPWSYPLTNEELRLLISSTVVNGANPWLGYNLREEERASQLVKEELKFFEDNEKYFVDSISMASAAIVFSKSTANFYGANMPEIDFLVEKPREKAAKNFMESFSGGYEALLRNSTPFDVIDEEEIEKEKIDKYSLILLPNVACMSKKCGEALKNFVEKGGKLIASFETSLYDEVGKRRENFLLSEVFGASYKGWRGISEWDLIKLSEKYKRDLKIKRLNLPSPTYQLKVEGQDSETMALYYEKMESRYSPFPKISLDPAIILHKFGKGACLYLAGNFAGSYWQYRFKDYLTILGSLNKEKKVILENLPSSVEIIIRKHPSLPQMMVSLINYTGEMERPIKKIVVFKDIKVKVKVNFEPKTIRALSLKKNLSFEKENDYICIFLPKLTHRETILFEG